MLPFYEEHDVKLLRILTDRETEYCRKQERHEYQLYLSVEDIEHTMTKVRRPQTNRICGRFHKTMQDEFYSAAFRKKVYTRVEELPEDVDEQLEFYNEERTHSGKYCFGKTPMQTFLDTKKLAHEKEVNQSYQKVV